MRVITQKVSSQLGPGTTWAQSGSMWWGSVTLRVKGKVVPREVTRVRSRMTQEEVKSGVNLKMDQIEAVSFQEVQCWNRVYSMMFYLRYSDLRGGVLLKAEGTALQHLEAKPLTLIAINIHGHDSQRKLSCVLHLETLSDSKERFAAAQTWWEDVIMSLTLTFCHFPHKEFTLNSHHRDNPSESTEEHWSVKRPQGRAACLQLSAALWLRDLLQSPCQTQSGCSCKAKTQITVTNLSVFTYCSSVNVCKLHYK